MLATRENAKVLANTNIESIQEFTNMRTKRLLSAALFVFLAACGSDETGTNNGNPECAPGETYNPITGACVPRSTGNNMNNANNVTDMDVEEDMFMLPDLSNNPFLDMPADVPPDMRCAVGVDSDQDLIENWCECELGTDPSRPDTDGDGLQEGQEDLNQNCRFDPGETDPRQADTDGDGANDGAEYAAGSNPLLPDTDNDGILDGPEIASGCMDPTDEDTDGDTLPDNVEDFNQDGMIGTCPNNVWMQACSQGESDPCSADTDGDGTPDSDEVQYLGCRPEDTASLMDPQLVVNMAGDYKLALETGVSVGAISGAQAHAFNDAANDYAGFIATSNLPGGATTADAIAQYVFNEISAVYPGASQRSSGRRIVTHDGFNASAGAVVELNGSLNPVTVRNDIASRVTTATNVNPGLGGSFSAGPTLVVYEVVLRNNSYVLSLAVVNQTSYENDSLATGYRVDDITGGSAIAKATELLEDECVSYRVIARPQIDFIWVLDGSGSMSEEIGQVKAFASQFVNILQMSNIDWRIGVTSGTCWNIDNDVNIGPEIKAALDCPPPPIGMLQPVLPNGQLCNTNGANFTNDPAKFADCIDELDPSSIGFRIAGEHTVTMGAAAIDRALPRSDTDNTKIRPEAAVVVISVTDEFDDHFQAEMNWADCGDGSCNNDPTINQSQLDAVTDPFVSYFLKPDVGATVMGIYWIPGQACQGNVASEAAAGINDVVNKTGGLAGSICASDITPTLQAIAEASVGIASGLRLRGIPAPQTIDTKVGQVSSGTIVTPNRSRADGWDYDSVVNRVLFSGPNPPQTGDRVVIPYRRWAGSVRQCTIDADCPQQQKLRCIDGVCL